MTTRCEECGHKTDDDRLLCMGCTERELQAIGDDYEDGVWDDPALD